MKISTFKLWILFILHRTLTNLRRMFLTKKNLIYRVLNEDIKCTTYKYYVRSSYMDVSSENSDAEIQTMI